MRSGYHPSLDKKIPSGISQKEQGFYHKTAWRKLRLLALQRDHYLCQECLARKKITQATEVHHIVPLEDDPSLGLELSNLRSLCWSCHEDTKHKKNKNTTPVPGVRILKILDGSESENDQL